MSICSVIPAALVLISTSSLDRVTPVLFIFLCACVHGLHAGVQRARANNETNWCDRALGDNGTLTKALTKKNNKERNVVGGARLAMCTRHTAHARATVNEDKRLVSLAAEVIDSHSLGDSRPIV